MKNKVLIKSQSLTISWDDSPSNYARARKIILDFSDMGVAEMIVDERCNDIFPILMQLEKQKSNKEGINFILRKYEELKNSDFKWKFGDGFEGVSLKLETFIEFLKKEDRDLQINKILQC